MVRVSVRLTEDQRDRLKRMAGEQRISVSELVRRCVDTFLLCQVDDSKEARKRAREAVGFADSGIKDLAERHDEYFVQAIEDHHRL